MKKNNENIYHLFKYYIMLAFIINTLYSPCTYITFLQWNYFINKYSHVNTVKACSLSEEIDLKTELYLL